MPENDTNPGMHTYSQNGSSGGCTDSLRYAGRKNTYICATLYSVVVLCSVCVCVCVCVSKWILYLYRGCEQGYLSRCRQLGRTMTAESLVVSVQREFNAWCVLLK